MEANIISFWVLLHFCAYNLHTIKTAEPNIRDRIEWTYLKKMMHQESGGHSSNIERALIIRSEEKGTKIFYSKKKRRTIILGVSSKVSLKVSIRRQISI